MKDYKIITWTKEQVEKEVNELLEDGYITDNFAVYDRHNVYQTVFKPQAISREDKKVKVNPFEWFFEHLNINKDKDGKII